MEKKNGSGEKWGGRSLNAYTHFSLFQLPRTSQRGSRISFFWQLKRPFPTRKIDLIWLYKNKYQIEKNMSGWEWDRVRVSRLGTRMGRNRNNYSTLNERVRSTRTTTVRLGHVTPQAPGHRTIYCNDREANQPVRFKVWRFLSLIYLFIFLNSPLFGCWENLKEGRKFIRLKNCWIWLRYCLHGFDDGQNQDSNFGGLKCKDFYFILFIL